MTIVRFHFRGFVDGEIIEGVERGVSLEAAVRLFERKIGRTFHSFAEILPASTPHQCC